MKYTRLTITLGVALIIPLLSCAQPASTGRLPSRLNQHPYHKPTWSLSINRLSQTLRQAAWTMTAAGVRAITAGLY